MLEESSAFCFSLGHWIAQLFSLPVPYPNFCIKLLKAPNETQCSGISLGIQEFWSPSLPPPAPLCVSLLLPFPFLFLLPFSLQLLPDESIVNFSLKHISQIVLTSFTKFMRQKLWNYSRRASLLFIESSVIFFTEIGTVFRDTTVLHRYWLTYHAVDEDLLKLHHRILLIANLPLLVYIYILLGTLKAFRDRAWR